jgi:hypothetical protein
MDRVILAANVVQDELAQLLTASLDGHNLRGFLRAAEAEFNALPFWRVFTRRRLSTRVFMLWAASVAYEAGKRDAAQERGRVRGEARGEAPASGA